MILIELWKDYRNKQFFRLLENIMEKSTMSAKELQARRDFYNAGQLVIKTMKELNQQWDSAMTICAEKLKKAA